MQGAGPYSNQCSVKCCRLTHKLLDRSQERHGQCGLQGRQELVGGIGRGTELETDLDPVRARDLLQAPDKLLSLKVDFVDNLCE